MTAPDYHLIPCHQCAAPVTVPAHIQLGYCCTCWARYDPYYDPFDNDFTLGLTDRLVKL